MKNLKNKLSLELDKLKLRKHYGKIHNNLDIKRHIREAAQWLCRAQDFGVDRGVAYGTDFGKGFMRSYPETTGYIIPTFIQLADYFKDSNYLKRAIEMGDWEIDIQMDSGAVMAGMLNENPTPAVFNTGQVIFGWNALYLQTGEQRFLNAAKNAANWLIEIQEPDGNWLKFNSSEVIKNATLYNVRVAWALCDLGKLINEDKYVDAAIKNANFALKHQRDNGWFSHCALGFVDDPESPLLHTIAYTMEGLLGIGLLTKIDNYITAAKKTADSLLNLMDSQGFLPGRIDSAFKGVVKYCCLTGSAQTSIVWSRLYKITDEKKYKDAVHLINEFLMKRHDIFSDDPTIRGGIPGSWPVWGAYGQFKILNWATKFFIDALLESKVMELSHQIWN